jgi:hypothetical protein
MSNHMGESMIPESSIQHISLRKFVRVANTIEKGI